MPDNQSNLRRILADHYVTAIECCHEEKTDTVRCSCSRWTGTPQPSVGAAVQEWVGHVAGLLALRPPAPAEPVQAQYSFGLFEHSPPPWRWRGMNLHHARDVDPEDDNVPLMMVSSMSPSLLHFIKYIPEMVDALGKSPEGSVVLDKICAEMQAWNEDTIREMKWGSSS